MASEGTHTIQFLCLDAVNNHCVKQSAIVFSDVQPIMQYIFNATEIY